MFKRALVIGCSGAGKSTFARSLHAVTGLPLCYLDMLWHKPDRTCRTREEFDALLAAALAEEEWIIDGNYLRTLEVRLKACDAVFLFDLPTAVCLEGVRRRIGRPREDMPWVEQEFDPEFRRWIENFERDKRPEILRLLDSLPDGVLVRVFRTRRQSEDFLRRLAAGAR